MIRTLLSCVGFSILIAVAALVVWIAVRAIHLHRDIQRRWSNRDESGIEEALTILLNRGRTSAFVIFTDADTDLFVQFRKYGDKRGEAGIEMHFPRAPWSEEYYDRVQRVLRVHQVPFKRVPLEGDSVVEVILADLRNSVKIATRVTSSIMQDVFGRPAVNVRVKMHDIAPVPQHHRASL